MTNQLWYGDNLNIMRAMPAETIDLIYLDPPYNSKRDYNVTFGSVAQSKAFTDTWSWALMTRPISTGWKSITLAWASSWWPWGHYCLSAACSLIW